MIEFDKEIKIYSYKLHDIYCCDCFFERVTSLLFRFEEFTTCDEFIKILEKEFIKEKFVFFVFAGVIVLICRKLIKFVLENKKDHESIKKLKCITDLEVVDGKQIVLCIVCFIKIIKENKILEHFKLKKKLRNEIECLYL